MVAYVQILKGDREMPLNLALVKNEENGELRLFKTAAKTREELENAFKMPHVPEAEVIAFHSFKSDTAEVLSALCEIGSAETELLDIFKVVWELPNPSHT